MQQIRACLEGIVDRRLENGEPPALGDEQLQVMGF